MRRLLWIVPLFLVLFLPAALAESAPSLYYEISSSHSNQLDVILTVRNGGGYYYHSAGGMEILSAADFAGVRLPYTVNGGLVQIQAKDFRLHYRVHLAALGKHGHQGWAENGQWMASGSQACLLPLGAYSIADEEIAAAVGSITLSGSLTGPQQLYHPCWADIHSLLKSCLTCGNYQKENVGSITLLSPDAVSPQTRRRLALIQERLAQGAGSFPEITVVLADPGLRIMGGAGKHAIGASFDAENSRDWELLCHRLFHACFDHICPHYAAHMPGNLWLYEGLAVYHEAAWQEDYNDATIAMLSRLQARMEYCRAADETFRIIPANESNLGHAATEFLHYTQAPLMVYELLQGREAADLVQAFSQAVFALNPQQPESDAAREVCLYMSASSDLMDTAASPALSSLPRLSDAQARDAVAEYLPIINSWLKTDGKAALQ